MGWKYRLLAGFWPATLHVERQPRQPTGGRGFEASCLYSLRSPLIANGWLPLRSVHTFEQKVFEQVLQVIYVPVARRLSHRLRVTVAVEAPLLPFRRLDLDGDHPAVTAQTGRAEYINRVPSLSDIFIRPQTPIDHRSPHTSLSPLSLLRHIS